MRILMFYVEINVLKSEICKKNNIRNGKNWTRNYRVEFKKIPLEKLERYWKWNCE